ncbi:MAG: PQQ-binding-like beta-propeller repeat protein [Candidatus Bathyarchaeota archaeon]|nr:PQQ-binding-like beta-propeller repeat protein [Candidatus Bathyarchaeota archaeon]
MHESCKRKKVAIVLILLLAISATISVATVQFEAHAIDFPTFLTVTASPNPVGQGQICYIGAQFSKPPPTTTGWTGDLYENVTIDIIDPNGKKTVYGPYTASSAAGVQFTLTPTIVGNYTIQAHYPGEILDGRNSMNPTPGGQMQSLWGSKMLPADSQIVTLVVQEEPVEPLYKTPPLPTEFWTRPIYGTNWNWGELGANWFGLGGSGAYDANRNFQPFGTAPNTPHIVWTMPTQFGGQPGAPIPADTVSEYSSTSLLQNYFKPQCILNGILYYNLFMYRGTLIGWRAVDIHTGEIVWERTPGETGNERIDWGQVFNYNNYQEFGSLAHLYSAVGAGGFGGGAANWFGVYDPFTGRWLANVTDVPNTSKIINYDASLRGEVVGYYVSGGNLSMYNYTKIFQPATSIFVSASGTINASTRNPIVWSVRLPTTFNGATISLSIAAVTPDVILMRQVPGAVSWQGTNAGFSYDAGYDAKTGALLWGPINQTGIWNPYEDTALICAGDGYYVLHNKDRNLAYGFSLKNGQKLWGPVQLKGGGYSGVYRFGIIGYGKVYIADLGGYVNALDLETGEIVWTFYAGSSQGDTPFESYPIFGYNAQSMADGKLFLSEGHMYTPPMHPAYRLAINCTDGTLVWKILQYSSTCVGPIADGFLISWNSFDNQIYCFGKGPTATTVTASPSVSVEGSSVLVTGTVMDKSGGTKQDVITTRFPDGLPAVADESMEAWMEYAYMQQVKPTDVKGVEVTVTVLDPNNNCYDVGKTTTDDKGFFKLAFTPPVPGEYSIYATFSGSESYYGSSAETAIYVESAPPATPPPTPTPAPMTDTYVLGLGAGAIIAIVIIGLVIILMLRKR